MMKQWSKIALILAVFFGLFASSTVMAADNETNKESINEKFGLPIVVLGESLSEAQREEVRKALEVDDPEMVEEITVTGEDLARYIQGEDRNARMFSSAKITRKEKGEGLIIERATPGNITEVTDEMYANALLTAGVEDATVVVASPVKVSGHSALTGIYKAYEVSGEKLDTVRMEVANEELGIATELAKEEGMDQEKVSELLTEIKKQIAEQNPATKEDVERIVSEQLQKLNIELSPEDRQLLIDLFDKMRNLDINFDNVKGQLEDISNDIKKRLDEVVGEEGKGFLQGILDFFRNLFQSIADLFK
ncbi:DUF1002 domain-containing protein [Rossellomorea vietnamensis]|uniref:DUF1002 domain-containing protein n=1 Tax=Rossellomorea vietnamensis TaxID=218284 RepID=A0A5D4K8I5_9BACI|nr:DUF1002 domain-containing protein [Rossellomorea vietnamensis]TYR73336.1 DUF1002 domain-containing protein [Rossellomorea vietnamensis]